MHQKDLIRKIWKTAGLYDEPDAKLQQFLHLLDEPARCWPELIDTCRRSYAAYKAKVTQPLLDSGDTLVRLVLIRAANPAEDDEVALLQHFIETGDPARTEIELRAIALKDVSALSNALLKKPDLPRSVKAIVAKKAPVT